ncbi:hypothetical protein RchiOBHm_Chr5g0033101 [Rosa chinensis]|uniref:Uncharacterized protein n=1 Tax=Rosa chinensis TaxID=74649 RepID=A0A2P6QAL7_ROSCH|nr:hypothetical protein RchiOBHm_Chr5g0033101 [Rosa chinensis]
MPSSLLSLLSIIVVFRCSLCWIYAIQLLLLMSILKCPLLTPNSSLD